MHTLQPTYLKKMSFTVDEASAIQKIGEFKGKQALFTQQTPEILESLQQVAIIESSESSNRLEGITAPRSRIEAIVEKSSMPANRSEREIAGYRDALALIHESARHMSFSVNVILQLHSMIHRYLPSEGGRWKMADNQIVERNPDGSLRRVRFDPVSWFDTPGAMDRLAESYGHAVDPPSVEPLILVPAAVFDFLCIHPFSDGNGRTARLLTLMLLYHFGYKVGRFISLERVFEGSKETYYEVLEASSANWHEGRHDPFPWINYFWGVLLKAYREFEERVGTIRSASRGTKGDEIRNAVRRRIGPFAISDIEGDCPNVSRDMIRKILRQLRDDRVIVRQGRGRGAKWIRRQD